MQLQMRYRSSHTDHLMNADAHCSIREYNDVQPIDTLRRRSRPRFGSTHYFACSNTGHDLQTRCRTSTYISIVSSLFLWNAVAHRLADSYRDVTESLTAQSAQSQWTRLIREGVCPVFYVACLVLPSQNRACPHRNSGMPGFVCVEPKLGTKLKPF